MEKHRAAREPHHVTLLLSFLSNPSQKKLEGQVNELMRANAKLKEQLSRVSDKVRAWCILSPWEQTPWQQPPTPRVPCAPLPRSLALLLLQNPALAAQVAALQSDVRTARSDGAAAGEEVRAVSNQLRAKDKELERMGKLVRG